MVDTFKTSDGAKIGYEVHGKGGVPLVLVNGLSAVMQDWSPLVQKLAERRKVLIFDHRGIGASYVPENWDFDLPMQVMANDIIALISHLAWKEVDLLGFSMGGQIVQTILTMKETITTSGKRSLGRVTIRKAILAATMTKLPRGDFDMAALQSQAEAISDREERKRWISTQLMKLQYDPANLQPGTEIYSKFKKRVEVSLATRRPAQIIACQYMAIRGKDTREGLSKIPETLLILIIHGHRDHMVRYDESNEMATRIKHARRFIPKQGSEFGHCWYDYFDINVWGSAIGDFLDDELKAKM